MPVTTMMITTPTDGNDAFPLDPFEWLDSDADTVGDNTDNCINDANADQSDVDVDGLGDICDNDNGVPVPVNDSVNIVANSSNNVIDVLANDDFGADGAGTFVISVAPTNGVATIDDNATPENSADDTIIYTPTTNYLGSDTLSYTITDASGSEASATVSIEVILELNTFNVSATNDPKILRFTWTGDGLSAGDHFSLQVDSDGVAGSAEFVSVNGGSSIAISASDFDLEIPIHLTDWVNAEYRLEVQASDNSIIDSLDLDLVDEMASIDPIGYVKSNFPIQGNQFGHKVSFSGDGSTMAVAALGDTSNATGIGGEQDNNGAGKSGAVYIFIKAGLSWQQQAYIKASNTEAGDGFGSSLALSEDGSTLAVGAVFEDSNAIGDQSNNSAPNAGAVYVFTRVGSLWSQQQYIKASNPDMNDEFGSALGLSADGSTLVVGAKEEDGSSVGLDGDVSLNNAPNSGAVYIFQRTGDSWLEEAYLKASNTDNADWFGESVSISADASTIAVGATRERSAATGPYGDKTNNDLIAAGAVYVFKKDIDEDWYEDAYIKASNTGLQARFGTSMDLSADGKILAIGASGEKSASTGIDGVQTASSNSDYGAVYLFSHDGIEWTQQHYIKANVMTPGNLFGGDVSLSSDGSIMAVGASGESTNATGINGDEPYSRRGSSGAAYVFEVDEGNWSQTSHVKAIDPRGSVDFGTSVSLSNNGNILSVGAPFNFGGDAGIKVGEDGTFTMYGAGAVYLY
jgi:hypothetical protein